MRSPALPDERQMVVKPEKEKETPEVAENPRMITEDHAMSSGSSIFSAGLQIETTQDDKLPRNGMWWYFYGEWYQYYNGLWWKQKIWWERWEEPTGWRDFQ
jgi:hypothetical protein